VTAHPLPLVAPEVIAGRLQRRVLGSLSDNPHIGVIGPSRSGKDHFVRFVILGLAKPLAKTVVFDVKPFHARGPKCAPDCSQRGDATWCGWGTDVGEGCQLERMPEHPGPKRYRVLVPGGYDAGRAAVVSLIGDGDQLGQLAAVREVMIVLSDAGRLTEPKARGGLALGGPLSRLMSEGASTAVPVVACSTSDKWAESSIKDQTPTKLIGGITGKQARDNVANLAGLPSYARPALDSLPARHFVYCDHADGGEPALAITTAPA
jgi:hypothetical protein